MGSGGLRGRAGRAGLGAVLALLSGSAAPALDEDASPPHAQQILERCFANLYGFSSVQRLEISSQQPGGRAFRRSAQVVRRGTQAGLNRMLLRLLGPGDLRGVGLLLLERGDFSYDGFLYQPALRRVRRVSMAQRRDPFFGTDVSFEDLESKRAAQWQPRLLREEDVSGRAALVLEVLPGGVPSSYERIVAWFDRELPIMLRAEFYRDGRRVKEMQVDPARVRAVEGYHVPEQVVFRGPGGSETTLELTRFELRPQLPDELFTRSVLEFGDADLEARER